MRILVWGMGYVGTVSAACFAQMGHDVIGVEPNLTKVQAINAGLCAIAEPGLEDLVGLGVSQGKLQATTPRNNLISEADLSLICVGTPSAPDGSLVTKYVEQVVIDIGQGISRTNSYHVVVVRSTLVPHVTENLLLPLLIKHSGKQAGVDFGLVVNPEFLREGSAISDFYSPPYTIIGEFDNQAGDVMEALYASIKTDIYRVTLVEAEMLKLVNNAFHALKIGFANEIGRLCSGLEIDSQKTMQLVCADTKLNISSAYLRPGFAFGGSCLPKDLRSLTFKGRSVGENLPILESILPSNQAQIDAVRRRVHAYDVNSLGILGLSFKLGTDDLRESPAITLARLLQDDGFDILLYDPQIRLDRMLGSNQEYLATQLPNVEQILCENPQDILENCQMIIICQNHPEFRYIIQAIATNNLNVVVINLVDYKLL